MSTPKATPSRGLICSSALALSGFLLATSTMIAAPAQAVRPEVSAQLFPLDQVHLLDGPFRQAQETDRQYILELEVDRLLAPFRREAGLEPKAEPYPNWESMGLDGHTAGHYLTALAQLVATAPGSEVQERLDRMVAELAEIQEANGDGYLGGIPGSKELWEQTRQGDLRVDLFSFNGKWVPWYNIHKTFAGLRDAYLVAGNEQARDVLVKLSDWCLELLSHLDDEQMQNMLVQEHGGMNEILADVYAITGDKKYLDAAERFSHRLILNPLLQHEDKLTGLHANTQIPKVIGFARIAELGGDVSWLDAADFFWDRVVHDRSVAIGGNSVREHFHPTDDFGPMIESREGPETCNSYNMLRLTELLYRADPASSYADYYERTLYNHILSSQHPGEGGFVYFTPMRPQHYRVYSQPTQCFWCCVGSGMENHGKYGQFIYAHNDESLILNLFIPSKLEWKERGITVTQKTEFPVKPSTTLHFALTQPDEFKLEVRLPAWAQDGVTASVNGKAVTMRSNGNGYGVIERRWQDGDIVQLNFDMKPRLEPMPGGNDYVTLLYGPLVLAAKVDGDTPGLVADAGRMAHAAPGEYMPLEQAPMLEGTDEDILTALHKVDGEELRFSVSSVVRPEGAKDLVLQPFYTLHDSRYMIYWRQVQPGQYEKVLDQIREEESMQAALDARTLDHVAPGEQQDEVGHHFAFGSGANAGAHLGRHYRDAADWFSYEFEASEKPSELQVTYYGAERGRKFNILINGEHIAHVKLDGNKPDEFSVVTYDIPGEVADAAKDGLYTIRFEAAEGSRAGPVYGVRLLK